MNPHEWLGREPALPLHHLVNDFPPKRKLRGGRVIQCGIDQGRFAAGEWAASFGGYEKLLSVVTKDDVVYVPLWNGCLHQKVRRVDAAWLADGHEDLRAFIRDLAPRVGAVLLGNAGIELTFWQPEHNADGYDRHLPEMLDFVGYCAALVREAGGRPAFGTVDWDIAFDCYGGQELRQFMLQVDALQIIFCGYTLIPEGWCDREFDLYSRQLPFLMERERKSPFIHLMRYLDGLDVWSGCNGKDGLLHQQDECLAKYNFKGGMYRP
jgi:hypothetical protein